jgi:branched-chain amino acid transport system ATP-binding protein
MTNATAREAARAGLVHIIEGHCVFTQISVADNLLLAGYDLPRSERATRVEEAWS